MQKKNTTSKAQTKHATLHACFFNICNSFFKAKRIWIKTGFLIPRCAKTQVQLHCFPLSAFSESCRFVGDNRDPGTQRPKRGHLVNPWLIAKGH